MQVWPAGVEPAVSGSRSRRGGRFPPQPDVMCHGAPAAGLEPAPRDHQSRVFTARPRRNVTVRACSGPGRSRTCTEPIESRQLCRTSSLLFVGQALSAVEPLAPTPGQGFEPRPPRSEHGVLAVRRSRKEESLCLAASVTRRCCSSHSPTLRPWIAAASPLPRVFVEAFWSPALYSQPEMCRQKRPLHEQRHLPHSGG